MSVAIDPRILENAEKLLGRAYRVVHDPAPDVSTKIRQLRYRFFCEHKRWVASNEAREESDALDGAPGTRHFAIVHRGSEHVLGYVRTIHGRRLDDFLLGQPFFQASLGDKKEYFAQCLESTRHPKGVVEASRLCADPAASRRERMLLTTVASYVAVSHARSLGVQSMWIQTTPRVARLYRSHGGRVHFEWHDRDTDVVFLDLDIWSTPESFSVLARLYLRLVGEWVGWQRKNVPATTVT